jgi:hypothetical protein
MPSAHTNRLDLEERIRQLQLKEAQNGGLNESNAAFLAFLQKWAEFANTDPIIVIQPKGALLRSGQPVKAKIIAVTDRQAADLFAFAAKRQQLVRLATDEERERYFAHVQRQRDRARGRAAAEKVAIARNLTAAMLGHESVPFVEPMPTTDAEELEVVFNPPAPDAASLVPANLDDDLTDGEGAGGDGPDPTTLSVSEVAGKPTAKKLVDGGIATLGQLAAATPDRLVGLGIAAKTAAGLIAAASEAVAPEGDADGEGAGGDA